MESADSKEYVNLTISDEVDARHADFAENFGNDGFFEDALITCLGQIDRICTVYFGEEASAAGLDAMVGHYFPKLVAEGGWRHALDEEFSGIYSALPIGGLFHDLDAYANYGIVLAPARDEAIREKLLAAMVTKAEGFLAAIPLDAWGIRHERAVALVQKASARFKLDTGQPVNAEELSAISGLAPQSIKNRLAGTTREIVGNQNKIEAREALAWLSSRKDFRPSLWRQQDDGETINHLEASMAEAVFIPVAADGSAFTTGSSKNGYFYVGAEGYERRFETYDEALLALQAMVTPVWRRPTAGGTWTRVRATGWRRIPRSELINA